MISRAFMISTAAHLILLLLLWQISAAFSRPVARAYPRLMTATLVAKSVMAPAAAVAGPSAAAPARPEPKVNVPEAPQFKPAEKKPDAKKKEPLKAASKSDRPQTPAASKTAPAKSTTPAGKGSSPTPGAASASGAGGGNSMRIDAAAFPYEYYSDAIQNRIESNWQAPQGTERLVAVVHFKIARNGEIKDLKLEQASGSFDFDRAAISAVTYANPLPPLPVDYREPTLVIRYEFVANNF